MAIKLEEFIARPQVFLHLPLPRSFQQGLEL